MGPRRSLSLLIIPTNKHMAKKLKRPTAESYSMSLTGLKVPMALSQTVICGDIVNQPTLLCLYTVSVRERVE